MFIVTNSVAIDTLLSPFHKSYIVRNDRLLEGCYDPKTHWLAVIDLDCVGGECFVRPFKERNPRLALIGLTNTTNDFADWISASAKVLQNGGNYLWPIGVDSQLLLSTVTILKQDRETKQSKTIFCEGRLVIDQQSKTVLFDNEPVPISRAEYKVLCTLCNKLGGWVSTDELMQAFYGNSWQEHKTKIISVYVCHIRKKFNDLHPNLGTCIITGHGFGYQLTDTMLL